MRTVLIAGAAALVATATASASAQDLDGRVGRLESEMRAVQRKVFPGGAGQLLQPEIAAAPPQASAPGSPASSAVADLSARVTSLEQQLATLTGQSEQNTYRIRQLQDQFDAYKRATDAKLATAAAPATPAASGDEETDAGARPSPRPAARPPARPAAAPVDDAPDASPGTSGGVDKPSTGDPAEDGYIYGYRLWEAKKYPQAEVQLKRVVADYPKSRRASYAQNLLGRAYLDDGKPSLASMAFYDNYKKMPDGERAPDSLYYLAQALMKLNKPADACKVYGELTDVYSGKISSSMQADITKGRAAAKCQ